MAPRLATAMPDTPRPSARVKTVAETYFDSDDSQVRRLIDAGELEAHTFGKRGVRVYLDSVAAYQQRHTKPANRGHRPVSPPQAPSRARASRAAHHAAMMDLEADGFL